MEEAFAVRPGGVGEALHALEAVQQVIFRQVVDVVRASASHPREPIPAVARTHVQEAPAQAL